MDKSLSQDFWIARGTHHAIFAKFRKSFPIIQTYQAMDYFHTIKRNARAGRCRHCASLFEMH